MLIYRNGVLSNFISESDWYQPFDLGAYYCLAANQDGGTDFYVSYTHSLFWNDSAGGCSDLETYAYCDVPESDCPTDATWFEPGAVLDESGCCLCSASCDEPDARPTFDAIKGWLSSGVAAPLSPSGSVASLSGGQLSIVGE